MFVFFLIGGIKNSVSCVRGPGVYRALRCEGGVHRVQRVPLTDKNARLHTSTATVVVMPEPNEVSKANVIAQPAIVCN